MARRSVAAALLLAVALCAGLYKVQGVTSVVTEWLTVAQNSVLTLGIEHQQGARVYGIVATGRLITTQKLLASGPPSKFLSTASSNAGKLRSG